MTIVLSVFVYVIYTLFLLFKSLSLIFYWLGTPLKYLQNNKKIIICNENIKYAKNKLALILLQLFTRNNNLSAHIIFNVIDTHKQLRVGSCHDILSTNPITSREQRSVRDAGINLRGSCRGRRAAPVISAPSLLSLPSQATPDHTLYFNLFCSRNLFAGRCGGCNLKIGSWPRAVRGHTERYLRGGGG